jgi:hypothetical protein
MRWWGPCVACSPPLDFSRHDYAIRTEDKMHWPALNAKAITSRKSLAAMFMDGHVTRLLTLEGRIPVVVSQNKNNPELLVHTPFGPMLDSNSFPCRPGQIFLSSTIYEKFGLRKGKGFNDAWNSDVWQAGACSFRLPEKKGCRLTFPSRLACHHLGK